METWAKKRTFKQWIKRYVNKDTPLGDLARDVAADPAFPDSTDLALVGLHLSAQFPCYECIDVFRTACKRYTTWLMKELWGDD